MLQKTTDLKRAEIRRNLPERFQQNSIAEFTRAGMARAAKCDCAYVASFSRTSVAAARLNRFIGKP
jgi:hypothetical protein